MNVSQLISQFNDGANDFEIVGFLCWWSIHNVNVTRERLIEVLKGCGIDEKFARSHNYRAAFIRSLRELEENRIIRPVSENAVEMVYQFTAETKVEDDDVKLKYDPETLVKINKAVYRKTQSIAEALHGREDIRQKLIEIFDSKKDMYHSSDITRLIKRIFSEKADIVSLREQGSVYYVPSQFQNILGAVASFVNSIGGSSFQYFPLPNVEACRQAVAAAVDDEMRVDLEKMEKEIEEVSSGNKEITERWRNHKIKTLENIQKRVARYSEVLEDSTAQFLKDNYQKMREAVLQTRTLDI